MTPQPVKQRSGRSRSLTRCDLPSVQDMQTLPSDLLEMLQAGIHPSAYYQGQGQDDKGRTFHRFNYSDRGELCYTGNVHEGSQNFSCFVTPDGMAFMRCFSERCSGHPPHSLGQVTLPFASVARFRSRFSVLLQKCPTTHKRDF